MAKSINRLLAELVEPDGDVKASALDNVPVTNTVDSAAVVSIADNAGIGLSYLSTLDSLPTSGLSQGDQAFVEANKRLYVSNGNGWYNVSLINLTPQFDSDINSAFSIIDSQTPLVISNPASDSDNPDAIITYGGTMSDSGQYLVALTRDSSVWTFTPLSADSVYDNVTLGNIPDSNGGTFTYSFTASDNINQAVKTITITYDGLKETIAGVVDSSSATVLLMKATGNSAVNSAITYQNASDVSTGFTETDNGGGGPQGSTFSPFRSGGYSYYFDGSTGYIQFDNSDQSLVPETGDFTVEFWFNTPDATNRQDPYSVYNAGTSGMGIILSYSSAGTVATYHGNTVTQQSSGGQFSANTWHHLAVSRSGTTQKIFIDGTEIKSDTVNTDYDGTTQLHIGNAANNSLFYEGYIRDVRFVKGSSVYGGNFTPPTEPLTAITNTQLLTCNLPYFGDASTNNRTPTVNGTSFTEPFSPYNYEPWNSTDFIGSVYVPYSDHLKVSDYSTVADFGAGNFTLEGWFYSDNNNNQYQMFFSCRATGTYRLIVYGDNNTIAVYLSTSGSGWTHSNTNSGTFEERNWTHIALVRNGGTVTLYVNGKGTTVTSSLGSGTLAAPTAFFVGGDYLTTNAFGGYVSDVRVVKGTAVYSSDFTPPTAPLTAVTNTQLLMQNKTDANVYDASASRVLKLFNDTVSSTTQRKFLTSSSVYFDGTGDYATSPDGATLEFKNSDWTIELWMYKTSTAASVLVQKRSTGSVSGDWTLLAEYSGTDFEFWSYDYNTFSSVMLQGGTISQNTWHHVAVTRYGNTWTMWVDGTSVATLTSTITIGESTAPLTIGRDNYGSGTRYFPGYIQDLRISKGKARYTSNFTPPTAEFTL